MIHRLTIVIVAMLLAAPASAQLRVVTYNIAQLRGNVNELQAVFEALHEDDEPGYGVPIAAIIFQEVRSADVGVLGARLNASAPAGVTYAQATYTNDGEDGVAGAQALFYRTDLLDEDVSEHKDIFTGAGRDTDRWRLDLVGYGGDPAAGFYIYSCHLKAGTGASNESQRQFGAGEIRDDADTLPAGSHIVFGGDMNFYDHLEPGYLEFIGSGSSQAFDPIGTGSWNGSSNAIKHTQSPRTISEDGLVAGGMDDRFDLQLSNDDFHDGEGLALIGGTYRSLGNDGAHFDDAINDGNNFYYPGDIPRSNALADALHDASDHLPVVADYQVPAVLDAVVAPLDHGTVIVGAAVGSIASVSNAAIAIVPEGADELDYVVSTSGDASGGGSGSVDVFDGDDLVVIGFDTSAPGARSGTITVATSSEGAAGGPQIFLASADVLRHADASFSSSSDLDAIEVSVAVDADTGVHAIDVDLHNLGFDAQQALLDVDAATPVAAPFALDGALPTGIGATPGTLEYDFDSTGLAAGTYDTVITLDVSDEDLPGATSTTVELTLTVEVDGATTCPEDFNGDGQVDVADVLQFLGAWGPCPGCVEDLSGDDIVDVTDLLQLLGAWGPCS